MSTLGHPAFSFTEAGNCGAGLRSAYALARTNKRNPRPDLCTWLAKWVRPECLADNVGTDYPDAKKDSADRWARAGYCHGVLDAYDGRDARPFVSTVTRERHEAYVLAYMAGRMAMTGVDA